VSAVAPIPILGRGGETDREQIGGCGITTEPGCGTVFTVRLPRIGESVETQA